MKPCYVYILCVVFIMTGCVGRPPHPVRQMQTHDKQLSCQELQHTIVANEAKIQHLEPYQHRSVATHTLRATGVMFALPWFLMDFSETDRIEIQSYKLRNDWLYDLAQHKECRFVTRDSFQKYNACDEISRSLCKPSIII